LETHLLMSFRSWSFFRLVGRKELWIMCDKSVAVTSLKLIANILNSIGNCV
jgi:hypothetical protein